MAPTWPYAKLPDPSLADYEDFLCRSRLEGRHPEYSEKGWPVDTDGYAARRCAQCGRPFLIAKQILTFVCGDAGCTKL